MKNRKWTEVKLIQYYKDNIEENPKKMSVLHKNWYDAVWSKYKSTYKEKTVKTFIEKYCKTKTEENKTEENANKIGFKDVLYWKFKNLFYKIKF